MPTCACGAHLDGRRRKCEGCKTAGRTGAPTRKPRVSKTPRGERLEQAASPPADAPDRDAADDAGTDDAADGAVPPAGLGERGRNLWAALGFDIETPGGQLALEACRLADRLEHLDSALAGRDAWLDLVEQKPEGSGRFVVVVDKLLSESRQQQVVFKQLLVELGATRVKGNPGYGGETGTPSGPTPAPSTGPAELPAATPLDAMRERRRLREQKT